MDSGNAAQLNFTNALPLRGLCSCSARATSSLPTPDSPRMSTVVALPATCSMCRKTDRIALELPRMFFGRKLVSICSCNRSFSRCSAESFSWV